MASPLLARNPERPSCLASVTSIFHGAASKQETKRKKKQRNNAIFLVTPWLPFPSPISTQHPPFAVGLPHGKTNVPLCTLAGPRCPLPLVVTAPRLPSLSLSPALPLFPPPVLLLLLLLLLILLYLLFP
ncbi:hypothetical protein IF2G_10635 [Cordyceps javanica]|nr:hypothetical protein IF2G_10635 [Cordyceps javanica]